MVKNVLNFIPRRLTSLGCLFILFCFDCLHIDLTNDFCYYKFFAEVSKMERAFLILAFGNVEAVGSVVVLAD